MSAAHHAAQIRGLSKHYSTARGVIRAVDDIDLDVPEGASISIIGPNGAGKSTLLGLIAGVRAPSAGTVVRSRRCASLLELGAGFHPDLTGRENLDLGLGLAGASHRRRRRQRAAALEFADIGASVDRPVRMLSSGMVARLACAAAIHAEPDLLLIDEVLAVGDFTFQRRVVDAVTALVQEGASLLLVTHSLDLATLATDRCVLVREGQVRDDGPTAVVTQRYAAEVHGTAPSRQEHGVHIAAIALRPERIEPGQRVEVDVVVRCAAPVPPTGLRLDIRPVTGTDSQWMRAPDEPPEMTAINIVATTDATALPALDAGDHRVRIVLDRIPITPTRVDVGAVLLTSDRHVIDELSAELTIGAHHRRPQVHLEPTVEPLGPAGTVPA